MGDVKMLDGHTWTDRGDGVYLPDKQYIMQGLAWYGDTEHSDMTFIMQNVEGSDDHARVLLAMSYQDAKEAIWAYCDELGSNGLDVVLTTCKYEPQCIGGLTCSSNS